MNRKDINKFIRFGYNYDSTIKWIDTINWTCDADHIKNKFIDARETAGMYGVMPLFFSLLDAHNQQALIDYINNEFEK